METLKEFEVAQDATREDESLTSMKPRIAIEVLEIEEPTLSRGGDNNDPCGGSCDM